MCVCMHSWVCDQVREERCLSCVRVDLLSADSEKKEHFLRTENSNEREDRNRKIQSPESEPETKDNGVYPRPRPCALCSSLAVSASVSQMMKSTPSPEGSSSPPALSLGSVLPLRHWPCSLASPAHSAGHPTWASPARALQAPTLGVVPYAGFFPAYAAKTCYSSLCKGSWASNISSHC